MRKNAPNRRPLPYLVACYQAKKKQLSHLLAFTMPSQPVAACARWEAVLGQYAATLVTLDDVVNLPVTREITLSPATFVEVHRVTTKVAVSLSLLPNLS
jgi:hypothetical protein